MQICALTNEPIDPRTSGVASSLIYTGTQTYETPIPLPAMMRPTMSQVNDVEPPMMNSPTIKRVLDTATVRLLPHSSAGPSARRAPKAYTDIDQIDVKEKGDYVLRKCMYVPPRC